MTNRLAAEKWQELELSGLFDEEPREVVGSESLTVRLTEGDLEVIETALRRHFTTVKAGRLQIVHAMQGLRNPS